MRSLQTLLGLGLVCSLGLACSSGPKPPTPPPPDPPGDASASASAAVVDEPEAPRKPPVTSTLEAQGLSNDAMDKSVDPCEDFYQYACGGWEKATKIPSDRSRWSRSFSEIDQRNEADLHEILEAAAKDKTQKTDRGTVGRFYAACMDTAAIDKAGVKPLKPLLDTVAKVKDPASLTKALVALHKAGVWAFFDLSAGQDFKDATKMIGNLDQNGLGLPDRDYYLKSDADKVKILGQYKEHVQKMFVLAGKKDADAKLAMEDVIRIESRLAKIQKSREERRDPVGMYNKVDRPGIEKSTPDVKWTAYFTDLGYPKIQEISITSPTYFAGLNELIKEEKPAAIQSYLSWQVIHASAPRLSSAFEKEDFAMQKALTGQDEQRVRWKRCIDATDEALGELLAQPFVEKRFGGASKDGAEMLVHAISDAMDKRLDELDWMDQATRDKARGKLKSMAYLIGYPAKWKKYDFAVGDGYFQNALGGAAFKLKDNLAKVGKPVDRGEWYMTPPTVNAYYDPQKNQMVFPAGILQPPFYSVQASAVTNLGAMGMVVGHELTHGFDDEGSQFDKDGNLASWWTPKTNDVFKDKGTCVEKQYGAYEVLPGVKLNGKLTLGENIADAGGVKLAFRAMKAVRASSKDEVIASGLNEDQQFFLSVGQIWCSKYKDETARLMAQVDPHSHPRFRVNGPLSHLPEFSKAFKCKAGSKMAVKPGCTVW